MKVIRLVEDDYNVGGIYFDNAASAEAEKKRKDAEEKAKKEKEMQAAADEKSDVDVNAVRNAFESTTDRMKDPTGKKALGTLNNLLQEVGTYNNQPATNLIAVLSKYKFKFVKYFLECLGYDNLGDRRNNILTALCTEGAKNLLSGNETVFTQLFNIANSKDLGVDAKYLTDNSSIIYDKNLYNAVADQAMMDDIVRFDVKNADNSALRDKLRKNLTTGNLGQFKTNDNSVAQKVKKAGDIFKNLSRDNKIKWLIDNAGLSKQEAERIVDNL